MEAPQENTGKLKLENRQRSKRPAKEKPAKDVICFECGAEVSGKLFLHYKQEHDFSIEEFKAAMAEASCDFHGVYQPPQKHSDKVKQNAELKRQEDFEKLRVVQAKEEEVKRKQREME